MSKLDELITNRFIYQQYPDMEASVVYCYFCESVIKKGTIYLVTLGEMS